MQPLVQAFGSRRYAHHTEQVHARAGKILRDLTLGLNDGMVASFAVTSGVGAASQTSALVIIAGLAETVGGAISMGLAAFASARAQLDFYQSEVERENEEIQFWPEHEREEIRAIYREKGFEGSLLDQIVNHITADRTRWHNVMMREELGFAPESFDPPLRSGLVVALSYLIGALVPVLPYFFAQPRKGVIASAIVALATLFVLGVVKGTITRRPLLRSGVETALIAALAAGAAFIIGRLVGSR
jgi:VIT1/CCC1 family predicted Fe2+/Mn2+ transporter